MVHDVSFFVIIIWSEPLTFNDRKFLLKANEEHMEGKIRISVHKTSSIALVECQTVWRIEGNGGGT